MESVSYKTVNIHNKFFLKRGPFSCNNICLLFCYFILWRSSLRPRCSKKVAFLHRSILHWCLKECNGNRWPPPPGSTVLRSAPGSLMTPRPGPQLTLELTTRPISTDSLEGLPICTSDHNATKSSWCLTLIQHVTSESPLWAVSVCWYGLNSIIMHHWRI